jgi:hypothetical protein
VKESAMGISMPIDPEESHRTLEMGARTNKAALIFHLKIDGIEVYKDGLDETNSRRLHRARVDPAPCEGMQIDETVMMNIALWMRRLSLLNLWPKLKKRCGDLAFLAVVPEPHAKFWVFK